MKLVCRTDTHRRTVSTATPQSFATLE
jgi:hypothetical protein